MELLRSASRTKIEGLRIGASAITSVKRGTISVIIGAYCSGRGAQREAHLRWKEAKRTIGPGGRA